MKKITSMFLALVMALALTIPAFASSGTVKVEGTIQLPTINVVLPTTASMVMNPYSMDVKLNPKDTTTVNDQIVSPVMKVTNLSNIDMQVGIQIAGTKGKGDAKFAAADPSTSTDKEAFIYAVFAIGDVDVNVTDPGNVMADAANVAILEEPAASALTGTLKDVTNFETVAGTVADANNTLCATVLDPVSNKQVAGDTGVLGFKFFGTTSPVTTWTDKDILGATLSFTFTPVANAAGGSTPTPPSAGDASVSVSISGTTATATFNAGTSGLSAASYAWTSGTTTTATVSGSTNTATITDAAGASTGDTSVITVTVTLDNGATVTGNATYTKA